MGPSCHTNSLPQPTPTALPRQHRHTRHSTQACSATFNSHCHTHTLTPSPPRSGVCEWPGFCQYWCPVAQQRGRWHPLEWRGRGTPVRPKHTRVPSVPPQKPREGHGLSSRHRLGGQPHCTLQDLARVASASPLCSPYLPPSLLPSLPPSIHLSLSAWGAGCCPHQESTAHQAALCPQGAHMHRPWGLTHTGTSGSLTYGRTLPPPCSHAFRQVLGPVVKVATQPHRAHASTTAPCHPLGHTTHPGPQG